MKKNILVLFPESIMGGAEKLILNQIKFNPDNKNNYLFMSLRPGNIENQFKNSSKNYSTLSIKKHNISIKSIKKILNTIKFKKIDLIHIHLTEPEIYIPIIKLFNPNIKIIVTKHNINPFKKKLIFQFLHKFTSLFVDKYICVSKTVNLFSQKYEILDKNKNILLPTAIFLPEFKSKKSYKAFRVNKDDFIIATLGVITHQKGFDILIDAANLSRKKIKNLKIIIAGSGPKLNELKEKVSKLNLKDTISFSGYIKDLNELYYAGNVFCIPSRYEGLPAVLLEAMATKNLILASNLKNFSGVLKNNKNSILFESENPKNLSKKINFIYSNYDKLSKLKIESYNTVIKNHNITKRLKKLVNVYNSAL